MDESIKVLDILLSKSELKNNQSIDIEGQKKQREIRLTNLLADFDKGYAHGWYMCVPSSFREALDIKFTTRKNKESGIEEKQWTQGSLFNFSQGDVFYNEKYSYCYNFIKKAPKEHPRMCIQIESAIACKLSDSEGKRYPGEVYLKIYFLETGSDNNIEYKLKGYKNMTQDDLVSFLITGPDEKWFNNINMEI